MSVLDVIGDVIDIAPVVFVAIVGIFVYRMSPQRREQLRQRLEQESDRRHPGRMNDAVADAFVARTSEPAPLRPVPRARSSGNSAASASTDPLAQMRRDIAVAHGEVPESEPETGAPETREPSGTGFQAPVVELKPPKGFTSLVVGLALSIPAALCIYGGGAAFGIGLIAGLVLGIPGLIFLIPAIRTLRTRRWLEIHGTTVDTFFVCIERDTSTRINGSNPRHLVTEWRSPRDGSRYHFRSLMFLSDPASPLEPGRVIKVKLDPDDPRRYWMDSNGLERS